MSKSDAYLQFPLCALSFGKTEGERLNGILDYAIVQAGIKLWRKTSRQEQALFMAELEKRKLPAGFHRKNPLHCAALYGADTINVTYPDFRPLFEHHQSLKDYVSAYERRYGRDPLVRIKREWFFKARDNQGLTYREFAVLCAIYACIGDKQAARITQPRIQRCALGYKTAAILNAEIALRADGQSPFSARQLRTTIEKLHRNKFFARCTIAHRLTYYSIRLDNEQFRKCVREKLSYPSRHRAIQAAQNQALTEAIKRARAECSGTPPGKPTV